MNKVVNNDELTLKPNIKIYSNFSRLPRFHVPFWLSHILIYFTLYYLSLCPSLCPS